MLKKCIGRGARVKYMQGVRLPDGQEPKVAGEYAWMPYALWECVPSWFEGDGEWHIIASDGNSGAIRKERDKARTHTWEVHEDGTVSFHPSLVMPSGWHGHLTRGVFSP
jgi:hypothetical protein